MGFPAHLIWKVDFDGFDANVLWAGKHIDGWTRLQMSKEIFVEEVEIVIVGEDAQDSRQEIKEWSQDS